MVSAKDIGTKSSAQGFHVHVVESFEIRGKNRGQTLISLGQIAASLIVSSRKLASDPDFSPGFQKTPLHVQVRFTAVLERKTGFHRTADMRPAVSRRRSPPGQRGRRWPAFRHPSQEGESFGFPIQSR